jgi:hypothetical protein
MQDFVGFEDTQRLDESYAGANRPPFSCVPHPVNIEPVASHSVDAGEGRVELFAKPASDSDLPLPDHDWPTTLRSESAQSAHQRASDPHCPLMNKGG